MKVLKENLYEGRRKIISMINGDILKVDLDLILFRKQFFFRA